MTSYVLFGAGEIGRIILRIIGRESIFAFCDNNKAGEMIEGVPVLSLEAIVRQSSEFNKVVISTIKEKAIDEISTQLNANSLPFITVQELMKNLLVMRRYVLVGKSKDICKYAIDGGTLQKDTIFSVVDNWNVSEHEYCGIPLLKFETFSLLVRKGLVTTENMTFVVTTETVKHTANVVKSLERNGWSYTFFEDVVREQIREEAKEYTKQNTRDTFENHEKKMLVCWRDRFEQAGTTNNYFWQDLWAAKRIFKNPVGVHYDIGSRVDGFDAHLLSFGQMVRVIDIRPLETEVEGMEFCQADATNLDMIEDESIDSLSALCSIEHFGLGRYGDPIDAEACFKCFDAIQRKMKVGGMLYLALPIGKERLEFNACRIFYASTVIGCFDKMELLEFSVTNNGVYEENVEIDKYDNDLLQSRAGQIFGLFMFKKVRY